MLALRQRAAFMVRRARLSATRAVRLYSADYKGQQLNPAEEQYLREALQKAGSTNPSLTADQLIRLLQKAKPDEAKRLCEILAKGRKHGDHGDHHGDHHHHHDHQDHHHDHHDHHHDHHNHAHGVEEKLGLAPFLVLGAIGSSAILYNVSRPRADGRDSGFTKWLSSFDSWKATWAERNDVRTQILEQAAFDKHLLYYAPRSTHIELKYPEQFQHGSPYNVPAGHYIKLDRVVEHYRKQHQESEARQRKKIEAAAADGQ